MAYNKANAIPTEAQKEMNNGMTLKKMMILTYRVDANTMKARNGRISWTKCSNLNRPIHRDIRILAGDEVAYMQG